MSTEAHITASFRPREPGQKATKRPVGRPRKHTLTESGQAQTDNNEVTTATLPSTGIEEPAGGTCSEEAAGDKCIQRQYTDKQKQRVVLYARHHGIRPAERKFGIPRKNIQQWLKSFLESDSDHVMVKRGPKKQRVMRGRQKAGRKLNYPKETDDEVL